jgi:hypothetical protein
MQVDVSSRTEVREENATLMAYCAQVRDRLLPMPEERRMANLKGSAADSSASRQKQAEG